MPTAAIYTRISQDRVGAGMGVARQEADCREMADRLGFHQVRIYSDNDVSAYSGKPRPEYRRLLDDIEAGVVDAVFVWHNDRLHRSVKDLVRYMEVAQHIPTHSARSGLLDLSTSSGRMTAVIHGAVAQQESEHKSERQRRKIQELAQQGRPLGGGRPFGYEADGMTIRESEAVELRLMVQRVLSGDSFGSILRDLNSRGVLTTRGNQWGYTSLRSLLLRPRNCARMQHQGKVVGQAAWPPIVSETEHDAVGALLANPARRTTTTSARRHLLSGLILCTCGSPMRSGWVTSRGRRYDMYRCKEKGSGHCHRNQHKVEEYVIARVLGMTDMINRPAVDLSHLETERDQINQQLEDAAYMFAEGTISGAQLAAITSTLNTKLTSVLGALNVESTTELEGIQGLTRKEWDSLDLSRRRSIIDAFMVITAEPVRSGPTPADGGVSIKLRSDTSPGNKTTSFGFTIPPEVRKTSPFSGNPSIVGLVPHQLRKRGAE